MSMAHRYRHFMLLSVAFATANVGCSAAHEDTAISGASAVVTTAASPHTDSNAPTEVVHAVAFRFLADAATQAQVPAALQAFKALKDTSLDETGARKVIKSFRFGPNNSTEGHQDCFILTFANVDDRNYYVDHEPNHQAFKALVGPLLDASNPGEVNNVVAPGNPGVFVYDFQTPVTPVVPGSDPVSHLVSFRFQQGQEANVTAALAAFADLKNTSKAPDGHYLIQSLRFGPNNSTEGQGKGFDVTFVLTFTSVVDRDYYVNLEPHHQAFKALVGPLLDSSVQPDAGEIAEVGNPGVLVFDFDDPTANPDNHGWHQASLAGHQYGALPPQSDVHVAIDFQTTHSANGGTPVIQDMASPILVDVHDALGKAGDKYRATVVNTVRYASPDGAGGQSTDAYAFDLRFVAPGRFTAAQTRGILVTYSAEGLAAGIQQSLRVEKKIGGNWVPLREPLSQGDAFQLNLANAGSLPSAP